MRSQGNIYNKSMFLIAICQKLSCTQYVTTPNFMGSNFQLTVFFISLSIIYIPLTLECFILSSIRPQCYLDSNVPETVIPHPILKDWTSASSKSFLLDLSGINPKWFVTIVTLLEFFSCQLHTGQQQFRKLPHMVTSDQ